MWGGEGTGAQGTDRPQEDQRGGIKSEASPVFNENRGTHMGVVSSSTGAAPPAHQHGQVQRESARAVMMMARPD